mgnify:CR=1 FL=1
MNTKSALRNQYRDRRESLTELQIEEWSIEISNRCLTLDLWQHSLYHLFMTAEKNKEVDTSYLLSVILGKDKQPVIPKIADDFLLGFVIVITFAGHHKRFDRLLLIRFIFAG